MKRNKPAWLQTHASKPKHKDRRERKAIRELKARPA